MAHAQPSDVQVRLGRELDAEETALVEARLDDVERIILSRIPDLDARIMSGALSAEVVKQVEADSVIRLVRNPDGYIQESDGSYSYQLSHEVAAGRLTILPDEWRLLGVGQRKVFTFGLTLARAT